MKLLLVDAGRLIAARREEVLLGALKPRGSNCGVPRKSCGSGFQQRFSGKSVENQSVVVGLAFDNKMFRKSGTFQLLPKIADRSLHRILFWVSSPPHIFSQLGD